ncbi:MAG TPA: hypothetical protein VFU06_10505 [Longimicrobiales bacterium]|nr:hypothetical protein [Longimicrobiales bacterium]
MRRPRTVVRTLAIAALLCAAIAVSARPAQAQTRADSAAVLLDAARRFEQERRSEVASALYSLILQRYGDTPAAAAIRARSQDGRIVLDRSGRTELLVWGTLYGLWLGVATPLMVDTDNAEAYGIGLLAGGPAGFLAARAYTGRREVTTGQARAITWGGTYGTWQGIALVELLDLGESTSSVCPPGEPCYEVEYDDNTTEIVAGAVVGGLAGITTGALLARKPISAGTAATVSLGSMWGTGYGAALSYIAGAEADGVLLAAMLGGNVALAGSALGQRNWQLTESRARLISLAGIVGGLAGVGVDLVASVDDDKMATLIPTIGATAGLVFGVLATRSRETGDDLRDPGPDGALLEVRDGRLGVGAALPVPRALQDGNRTVAGVYLPVFSARF